jgi:putative transposase
LWGRFASVAMDENHLLHAFRYVAMYPVRARLVMKAEDWRWSSATAHLDGKHDGLTKIVPALSSVI